MTKPIEFNVNVPRSYGVKASARVVLHPNARSMKAALPEGTPQANTGAFATVGKHYSIATGRTIHYLGEIHLNVKALHFDYIAHEVFHAVTAWLTSRKDRVVSLVDGDEEGIEEKAARIQGGLSGAIVNQCRKRGLEVV